MAFRLARALGPEIRVNIVAPGYVKTPWQVAARRRRREQSERRFAERAPLKAAAAAEDVAEAIVWLIEGARRVTGEIVYVDGGMHIARLVELTTSSSALAQPAVLANRLSKSSVLLLEAGPKDTDFWIHVPLGYGKLFTRTDINWAYESEPEPALNGRRIFTPRGKVLGGSSSINGLVYIRGQREGLRRLGAARLGLRRARALFPQSGAQLKVSDLERHELCDAFVASARALGIPPNEDFNGPRRKAPAITAPPPIAAGAGAQPRPILGPRGSDRACASRSTLSRRRCFSRARASVVPAARRAKSAPPRK